VKINYCSAPCGSGKTYQLVKSACRVANSGETVLFLQPTKELIDRTIGQELLRRQKPPPHEKIYGESKASSVARRLTEYLKHPMDGGHIVFATHQVLPFVPFWANQNQLRVLIDEELQIVKHGCFQIPNVHPLITNCIDLAAQDSIYSRVVVSNPDALSEIARNRDHDEIYEQFRETAQILTNPNWNSFANTERFCALREGHAKQLSIHSILRPQLLNGFASVTMTSANFLDSLIYKLWGKMGVEFVEDGSLSKALRFQEHTNGSAITIKYLTDLPWSKTLQTRKCDLDDEDAQSVLSAMIEAVKTEFHEQSFLWQANKSITTSPFGSNAQRLPNIPHGLNDYSTFDRICFLSALNPRTDHFKFLASRGVTSNDVRQAVYCSAVYQSVMRTSIREPKSLSPKTIIIPDVNAAKYLQKLFPGSRIEKLKTKISEQSVTVGQPRKYSSTQERVAADNENSCRS
jgi:Type III restriction enzyme, res subunit